LEEGIKYMMIIKINSCKKEDIFIAKVHSNNIEECIYKELNEEDGFIFQELLENEDIIIEESKGKKEEEEYAFMEFNNIMKGVMKMVDEEKKLMDEKKW